ncbi:MAG: hypothetical protein M1827_002154 [Pycnora praestabilis]|nr:MAG: hypothetical protein M1827_002154 [Pycnora praestabilis]
MSLTSSPAAISSKSTSTTSQTTSLSQSQTNSFGLDSHSQRRSGGSGNFGAGSTSRAPLSAARNNQSFRKQNKASKRSRFGDEDAAAESAAMKSIGSRKGQTSITHLMNFSLPPRPQNFQPYAHSRNSRKNPTWGLGSGYHAVDKARYVHANYRFIVNPNGDYHAQAVDADVHLEWGTVLQILASAQTQSASCPICLSTPVAPRMAKCGHIFCLPCLIRYMHSTDDTQLVPEKKARWKKCPICWDSIYVSDTRPVRWYTGQEADAPREGGDVVLRLIMRETGSTLALPRDGADVLANSEDIPWHFAAEVTDYARVMKGSENYMILQFDGEIEDLQRQEREDELMFGEETSWTKKAVNTVREAKERVKGIGNPPTMPKQPLEKKPKRPLIKFNDTDESVPEMYLLHHASKSGQSSSGGSSTPQNHAVASPADVSSASLGDSPTASSKRPISVSKQPTLPTESVITASLNIARAKPSGPDHYQESPYFFYQALLHYYLSPLDIRILKVAFGDFSAFPATILPRVERVSTGHIVDDELRKRAKYLAHLPYGCEVGFLECNWTDVVAPDVLEKFKSDIERRRKKNQDKEMREEKERVKAEKEEDDKRWAAARRKRPSIPRESFSEDDFHPLASTEVADGSAGDFHSSSASPPWSSARTQHGSAFASLASPSTSPVAPRTVWGTTLIAPGSPTIQALPHDHELATENDGWLQGWERDLLGEDDLIAQVQASSIGEGSSKVGALSGSGKKKKGKKITLMTTNARRGA